VTDEKTKTTEESIRNILNDLGCDDNKIKIAVNRIDLLIRVILRTERLKADYKNMRYKKGLNNYY